MINAAHLQTFLAIVETGTYTAAAERLHMSQSAVSQQIHALEEHFQNARLFRRVGQRMVPTHAGEELLTAARAMITISERAEQTIRSLRGQLAGHVVIGCTSSSGEIVLPSLIAQFRTQHPAVTVSLRVGTPEALLDDNLSPVMVAFLEEPLRKRGWESMPVGYELITPLAPLDHPLPLEPHIGLGMVREHPVLLPTVGTPLRRAVENGLRRHGMSLSELHCVYEAESVELLVQGVQAGLGIAFVPISRTSRHGVVPFEVDGMALQQEWHVARSRDASQPRAANEIAAFLRNATARAIYARYGIMPLAQ